MANEIYESTWWGNTIDTASSIGTSTEMIQGQFNLTKLGDELVTNGDFSNGTTGWGFTSGASLTDLGAKITHTPTAGSIAQSSILVIGKQYKLTYEITESISGGLKFNSAVDASIVTTLGVHTKYFEADGLTAVFGRTSSSNNSVTITNISIKEVRATTVEASKCLADAIHRIGIQDIQN